MATARFDNHLLPAILHSKIVYVPETASTHYDVNKRMGRFIINGLLLNNGYPAINLPAKRQLEFNQLMLDFYKTDEQKPMNTFMRSCLDDRVITIMKEE